MAHMVAGPGSCVETGRRSPPTQQIPDVFSVGSARDESRRGCTDGKTELLTSVDTSRRIASRSTSSANAPVFGDVLVRLADVQQRAAQSVGMGGPLACRSHVRGRVHGMPRSSRQRCEATPGRRTDKDASESEHLLFDGPQTRCLVRCPGAGPLARREGCCSRVSSRRESVGTVTYQHFWMSVRMCLTSACWRPAAR
jgi:hypothetical protein